MFHTVKALKLAVFAAMFLLFTPLAAKAQQFDENLAWPLCGRITEAPPSDWIEFDGCPSNRWGTPEYSDLPLRSTFGPRPLSSENNRYDFHRGKWSTPDAHSWLIADTSFSPPM